MEREGRSDAPPEASGREPRAATRSAEGSVELDAPPERVWRALTEARELERWFPLEADVEPGEGGSIFMSWKNEYAGASEILAWEPPRLLRTAWGWHEEEGEAQVTEYRLEGGEGRTFLRVVTSGFPTDAAWDEWVEGTRLGWLYELFSLKHYLERHDGEDRGVVYLRRRVSLERSDVWDRLFADDALGARPLGGRIVDVEAPVQYVAIVEDPPGSLLRVSTEPCAPGIEGKDVTLFLSAWGEARGRLSALEREWSRLLERLFPEGQPV